MKILHTGDWHLDKSTAGISRFEDVKKAAWETVETAIAEKVDLYCFTGDLADPDAGPIILRCVELAQELAEELSHAGILNWWIAGNHDVADDSFGTTTLSPMKTLGGTTRVFDAPALSEYPEWTGIVLPYPSANAGYDPAQWLSSAQWRKGLAGRKVVVAGHLTQLVGIAEGEETREMPRGRGIPWPLEECDPEWLLLAGHWHDRQEYRRAGRKVHVCGALARLTFGEANNYPSYDLHTF